MKIVRIIIGCFLIFCVCFTAFFGRYRIGEEGNGGQKTEYKGILKMWQIDGFEGGAGSRKQFLLKMARGFEKDNDGVLIMVTDYTVSGAEENIKNGVYPDIISYANGFDISGAIEIHPNRKTSSCMVGDKAYATVWCRGGYVLISNPALTVKALPDKPIENLLVSQCEYTQPLTALILEGISVKGLELKKPMDAYVKFVSGKTPYFLATQRDVVRLQNRGMNVNVYPLKEYNDLYQYVSVTAVEEIKSIYAKKFVDYLVSDKVQNALKEIKMFSEYVNVDYHDEQYVNIQSVRNLKTISLFTAKAELKELQRISSLYFDGHTEYINKIKNMLV